MCCMEAVKLHHVKLSVLPKAESQLRIVTFKDFVGSSRKSCWIPEISASLTSERPDLILWSTIPPYWNCWRHGRREFAEGAGFSYYPVHHLLTAVTEFRSMNFCIHFAFRCTDLVVSKIRYIARYCDISSVLLLWEYSFYMTISDLWHYECVAILVK